MSDKPILMSGPMVLAILDGRKTQTWQPIKPQPEFIVSSGRWQYQRGSHYSRVVTASREWWEYLPSEQWLYQVGDRLWVRETWMLDPRAYGDSKDPEDVRYRATDDGPIDGREWPWRPSIHMPRWASRLTLDVTDVRVERVQDISEQDARAEGFDAHGGWNADETTYAVDCRGPFSLYWDSLYAKRGLGWAMNPWVWVVSFKVVTPYCKEDEHE